MPNPADYPYDTRLNILYPPLEVVDVPALVAACTHPWYNQTLCQVNDSVVRLGVIQGEYHWHKHDDEDEFFYVVEGKLLIDLEGRTVELATAAGVRGAEGRDAPHAGAGADHHPDGRNRGDHSDGRSVVTRAHVALFISRID